MADNQESSGIIEKVKNLALGGRLHQIQILTLAETKHEQAASGQAKKDKKKDKKADGTASLEVSLLNSGADWHVSYHHLPSSSNIV